MASKATVWLVLSLVGCDLYLLQKLNLRESVRKPHVPSQVEAHREKVPLYHGYGAERRSEYLVHGNRQEDSLCVYKSSSQSDVQVLHRKNWCDLNRDPSKEGVMCSSIAREIGFLSVNSWWIS